MASTWRIMTQGKDSIFRVINKLVFTYDIEDSHTPVRSIPYGINLSANDISPFVRSERTYTHFDGMMVGQKGQSSQLSEGAYVGTAT